MCGVLFLRPFLVIIASVRYYCCRCRNAASNLLILLRRIEVCFWPRFELSRFSIIGGGGGGGGAPFVRSSN